MLEADLVLLAKGRFLRDAPNAPPGSPQWNASETSEAPTPPSRYVARKSRLPSAPSTSSPSTPRNSIKTANPNEPVARSFRDI